jgi:subfamily B ATP-binding cassette protein MsbA
MDTDRATAAAPKPSLRALRWLYGLARPYWRRLAFAGTALVLTGGIGLVLPAIAGGAIDAVLVERDVERLRTWVLRLFALYAVVAVIDFFEGYVLRATASRLLRDLRRRLHSHLLTLTPAFFERERVGELLSRLSEDVAAIGNVLTRELVSGAQQALLLAGALTMMLVTHARLTGVMLLAVPPVAIAAVVFGRRFEKLSRERQKRLAEATVAAEESLAGIRTVQAFVREGAERERYGAAVDRVLELGLRLARIWAAYEALVTMLGFSAITLIIWYGATLLLDGALTPGELTSFVLYTGTAATAIASITGVWAGLQSAAGSTQRIRELLATEPAIADAPGARPLGRSAGAFRFEGVRFAYPSKPDVPALDGVTIEARAGDIVALVGASGAGKSTLASLLLRFYDPQEGAVLVDGVDVRTTTLESLRGSIGYVSQDVFLFGGTVAENLRYGKLDASEDELRRAARDAHALEFVERLPQRFDTVVGERGVKLSAGERQRLSIARVLLADPRIVVLDEATSALDAESEHAVQRAFERLFEGRTTLVIAHRLATVRRATRVVVLEGGRVVEQGAHDELIASSGTYRRLCELQMLVEPRAEARPTGG